MAAILSGKGKLGTALTVLLVPLNCGVLVVDSVTCSVPCLPVFLYLLHLPLCQNAAIAKKKKTKKIFAFQLSLPLIICNCCVLDFFFNIIYSTLYGFNANAVLLFVLKVCKNIFPNFQLFLNRWTWNSLYPYQLYDMLLGVMLASNVLL